MLKKIALKFILNRLINFAYFQIGIVQALAAFATYFFVMFENGFKPYDVLHIREKWDNKTLTITDSYMREWVRIRIYKR